LLKSLIHKIKKPKNFWNFFTNTHRRNCKENVKNNKKNKKTNSKLRNFEKKLFHISIFFVKKLLEISRIR